MSTALAQPEQTTSVTQVVDLSDNLLQRTHSLLLRSNTFRSTIQIYGSPMALSKPIPASLMAEINTAVAQIERSLSTQCPSFVVAQAAAHMGQMHRRRQESADAKVYLQALIKEIANTAKHGVIPQGAVINTAESFASGEFARWDGNRIENWLPEPGEFTQQCKRYRQQFENRKWELMQFQKAVVGR